MLNKLNKSGQVAETATWVVATIIILIILIVALLLTASPFVKGSKTLPYTNKVDLFSDKSFTAYLLTKETGTDPVYIGLQNGPINDFSKNLGQQVFVGLYGGYYTYLMMNLNPGSISIAGFVSSASASLTDYTVFSTINFINKKSVLLEMSHRT